MRIFVQDNLSGIAFRRRRKACEENNRPVEIPGQAGIWLIFRGLFFERNPREIGFAFHRAGAETCPPPVDCAKRPFMGRH
jgi:hypothetical protein